MAADRAWQEFESFSYTVKAKLLHKDAQRVQEILTIRQISFRVHQEKLPFALEMPEIEVPFRYEYQFSQAIQTAEKEAITQITTNKRVKMGGFCGCCSAGCSWPTGASIPSEVKDCSFLKELSKEREIHISPKEQTTYLGPTKFGDLDGGVAHFFTAGGD